MSTPLYVSVGAVPDSHFTPLHHEIADAPPFVTSRMNEAAVKEGGTFVTENELIPVAEK